MPVNSALAEIMDIEKKIPNLCQFFGGYTNQDFNYEFGSIEGAVNAFFKDNSNDDKIEVAGEIEYILSLKLDDNEFDKLLEKAGCEYYTYADNLTGKKWVENIQKRIYDQVYS